MDVNDSVGPGIRLGIGMNSLTEVEKRELIRLIEAGEALPEKWRHRLFPNTVLSRVTLFCMDRFQRA